MIKRLFARALSYLLGGGDEGLSGQLRKAYEAKLNAATNEAALEADITIKQLETAVAMAQAANDDRWSATSLGRYLIVIPFGVWYSAIMIDSTFDMQWAVLALPQNIMALSEWLVPAIIVGDVGRSALRRR